VLSYLAARLLTRPRGRFNSRSTGVNTVKKTTNKEKVIAEITLFHLIRLGNEDGCSVSREQAIAFLNEQERAQMWNHMMQAGLDFVACSLFRQYVGPEW
jgi:hypothetical protein